MRLLRRQVKICQISYANFQKTSWFLPKFGIPLQFHEIYLLDTFFSSNNIYFAQKEHIKMKIFEAFKCLGQNSSNSSCQFWNGKSIPLQILDHSSFSWHNSSVDFKLILFLLRIKGSHYYPNFETLNCSGENLLYS